MYIYFCFVQVCTETSCNGNSGQKKKSKIWQLETQKGLISCQKNHSPDCKVLPQNETIFTNGG
jgi:hypothetical protein